VVTSSGVHLPFIEVEPVMSALLLAAADLVAIVVLVFASYFPRHRRRDMVLAYLGLNVGVLAVAMVLTGSPVSIGLGMGLFGVLSLIRLRSDELSHEEVAYYFSALALGLIFGLQPEPLWLSPVLGMVIVGVMALVDHAPIHADARHQRVTLDVVVVDEAELVARLEHLLGGVVTSATVQSTDLVRDSMVVDVCYCVGTTGAEGSTSSVRSGSLRSESPVAARDRLSAAREV
jgi:hypothetical protein